MIFDHGLDCIGSFLMGLTTLRLMYTGINVLALFSLLIPGKIAFYFSVYEQYLTG